MCTLTYLPTNEGFVLTHSRDEDRRRPSSAQIETETTGLFRFHAPKDKRAGGTWMGLHEDGRAACLLNGGQIQYRRADSYPVSRGEIIPKLWQYENFRQFFTAFDRSPYEPFTLVCWEKGRLHALYHNPDEDDWQEYDPGGAHIWTSTRLYPGPERWKRAAHFFRWRRQNAAPMPESIRQLHLVGQPENEILPFTIQRQELRTVSLTQVVHQASRYSLRYQPLPDGKADEIMVEPH